MRLFLIDSPTVKTLKLVYAPDHIIVSGTVKPVGAHGHEHTHETRVIEQTEPKDSGALASAPAHSFEPVILAGELSVIEPDVEDVVFSKTITFADLKALPGFAAHSQLALGIEFTTGEVTLHETFSRSYRTKKRTESMNKNHFYVLHVTVPSEAVSSFDDCMVFCTASKDAFTCADRFDTYTTQAELRAVVPTLKVEGPDAITPAGGRLVVTYAWPDGTPIVGAEVHSEVTAGYINRQRIHTNKEGKAYFTVLPLALDAGERFRVKFGFKHFTGKAEKVLTVS